MVGSLWGDIEGEICIYTGMLEGLTIMLENDVKQFWYSHGVTLQIVSSRSYDSLHIARCQWEKIIVVWKLKCGHLNNAKDYLNCVLTSPTHLNNGIESLPVFIWN